MRMIDADALKCVMIETLETIKANPKMDTQEMHIIAAFHAVGEMVDDAPTVDAVPVVRCGQCSHSEVCKMDEGDVRYCHIFEMQTEDDYFCADGERVNNDA